MIDAGKQRGLAAALSGAFAVGNLSAITLPIWVPQVGAQLHVPISSMGLLGSGELLCVATAALGVSRILARADARQVAVSAVGGIVLGNVMSLLSNGFNVLVLSRVLAGLSSGALLAVSDGLAGGSSKPQRTFALMQFVLVATVITVFLSSAHLVSLWGPRAVFALFALLALICLPLIRYVPRVAYRRAPSIGEAAAGGNGLMIGLAVVAIGACFVGQSAVWTYTAGIGAQIGLEPGAVGVILASGGLFNLLGPLLASRIGMRWGANVPMIAAIGVALVSISLLAVGHSKATFAVGVTGLPFSAIFLFPYLMGTLARLDGTGKSVAASSAVVMLGAALGPSLGGALLEHGGRSMMGLGGGAAFLLCGLCATISSRFRS